MMCLYDTVHTCKIKRSRPGQSLGIELKSHETLPPTQELAAKWTAPDGTQGVEGHTIFRIVAGTPATKAGCKAGDVLLSVDGTDVKHRVHIQLVQALMLAGNNLLPFELVVGRPSKQQIAKRTPTAAAPAQTTAGLKSAATPPSKSKSLTTPSSSSRTTTPTKKKSSSSWSSAFKTPSSKSSSSINGSSSRSSSHSSSKSKGKSKSSSSLRTPCKTPLSSATPSSKSSKGKAQSPAQNQQRTFRPLFIGTPSPATTLESDHHQQGYPTPASTKAAQQQQLLKMARATVLKHARERTTSMSAAQEALDVARAASPAPPGASWAQRTAIEKERASLSPRAREKAKAPVILREIEVEESPLGIEMQDSATTGFQKIIGVFPGGGVDIACSGAVKVGDELVAINGTSIQGLGHSATGMVIKECLTKGMIMLELATRVLPTAPPPKMSELPTSPPVTPQASPNYGNPTVSPATAAVGVGGAKSPAGATARAGVRGAGTAFTRSPPPSQPILSPQHPIPRAAAATPATPVSAAASVPAASSLAGPTFSAATPSDASFKRSNSPSSATNIGSIETQSPIVGGRAPRRSLTLPVPQPTRSSDTRGYATNAAIPPLYENGAVGAAGDADVNSISRGGGAQSGTESSYSSGSGAHAVVSNELDLITGIFGGYSINIVKTTSSPLGMVLQLTRGAHLIKRVVAGGAAAGRGVVAGDALVAINGESMLRKSHNDVITVLSSTTAVLTLTLAPLEAAAAAAQVAALTIGKAAVVRSGPSATLLLERPTTALARAPAD